MHDLSTGEYVPDGQKQKFLTELEHQSNEENISHQQSRQNQIVVEGKLTEKTIVSKYFGKTDFDLPISLSRIGNYSAPSGFQQRKGKQ